jgi:hypothetical protein
MRSRSGDDQRRIPLAAVLRPILLQAGCADDFPGALR